jgi:predicted RNA-binding protein with RPS1 domain
MKVLSIDVGIKNLAFCLLEKTESGSNYKIVKWDSINVADIETHTCCAIEKNKPCEKPAKFFKKNCYYCLKHSKKQTLQIPTSELSTSYINKQKFPKLLELVEKYNVKYEKPIKKAELVNILNEHVHKTCLEPITTTNASKTDLITIGKNIKIKFNEIFQEDEIDIVIIENQISPIANRMKTIQGMIAQYFIMKKTSQQIEFVSAVNKLKTDSEDKDKEPKEKTKYSDRKKMGIQKCLELLNNDGSYVSWMDYFKTHAKKDDLADSFLQGLWYMKKV